MLQDWPAGWVAIDSPDDKARIEAELTREMPRGHLLFDEDARVIARRGRRDDFLFELNGGRLAQVHLTWAIESDPFWPSTKIYSCFEDWIAALGSDES